MTKINYTYILIFLLLTSCIDHKDNFNHFSIFESKYYNNLNINKKLFFLDSIYSRINTLPNDSIKRNFLLEISAEYYYLNNNKKSFEVSSIALELFNSINDTIGIAKSYYYIGDSYEVSKKDSAYYYYQKAEKLYKLKNDSEKVAKMLFNKSFILYYEGNYLESEILISNALKLLNNTRDRKLLYSSYNLIGANFERLEEFDNALKYYLLADNILNELTKLNNEFDKKNNYKIMSVVNISNIYEKKFEYTKSQKMLESILSDDLKNKWPIEYSAVIGNLGYVKTKLGHLKEGEALMKEALAMSKKSGLESSIVYKLHNLGKYYFDIKDTFQATHYLKASLQLAEKIKSSDDVKVNLQLLSRVDKANTSYYDKRYIAISDSLTKVQRKNRNKYARIEYETSVVEDANKELSNRNLYLIVGVVVLAGALGIRYVLGQRKELAYRKRLQEAELELFDLMRSSQIALNLAKEEEQNRISKELHDNIMNRLYGTRLQLGMLNSIPSPDAEEKRSKQIDNLQAIEQDIRTIAHDLYFDVSSHFDFSELVASCVQQATTSSTEFHLDCDEQIDWETVSGLIKITLYRIIQEALSNVTKYAEASECKVVIVLKDNQTIDLSINDNGKGFDKNAIRTQGIGLRNMKERAEKVNSNLTITTQLGVGTQIQCSFKIN